MLTKQVIVYGNVWIVPVTISVVTLRDTARMLMRIVLVALAP